MDDQINTAGKPSRRSFIAGATVAATTLLARSESPANATQAAGAPDRTGSSCIA
jgi:hypothetical protein